MLDSEKYSSIVGKVRRKKKFRDLMKNTAIAGKTTPVQPTPAQKYKKTTRLQTMADRMKSMPRPTQPMQPAQKAEDSTITAARNVAGKLREQANFLKTRNQIQNGMKSIPRQPKNKI